MSTLKHILKTPDRGGLTSNVLFIFFSVFNPFKLNYYCQNLVYRYDVNKSDDGVGGEEGTFCLCTLWYVETSYDYTDSHVILRCIEALTRAGAYDKALLQRAVSMFEVSDSNPIALLPSLIDC